VGHDGDTKFIFCPLTEGERKEGINQTLSLFLTQGLVTFVHLVAITVESLVKE
jgi:hypothetical protein